MLLLQLEAESQLAHCDSAIIRFIILGFLILTRLIFGARQFDRAQALGGPMYGTGFEDGAPTKPGSTLGDTGAAPNCAMGVLTALHQRHVTGRGQGVEVVMQAGDQQELDAA